MIFGFAKWLVGLLQLGFEGYLVEHIVLQEWLVVRLEIGGWWKVGWGKIDWDNEKCLFLDWPVFEILVSRCSQCVVEAHLGMLRLQTHAFQYSESWM